MSSGESALVVLIPEAEALAGPFRDKYEPSAAAGVPAHITLLYPFKAPDDIDDLVAQLNDPGFEFTSRPQRIAHFTAFLNRIGTMKAKVGDWKELFWETAHHNAGD